MLQLQLMILLSSSEGSKTLYFTAAQLFGIAKSVRYCIQSGSTVGLSVYFSFAFCKRRQETWDNHTGSCLGTRSWKLLLTSSQLFDCDFKVTDNMLCFGSFLTDRFQISHYTLIIRDLETLTVQMSHSLFVSARSSFNALSGCLGT